MTNYHTPVLLHESVELLITDTGGVYVDATFGGGGHSKEILGRLSSEAKLFAFDQDKDALSNSINDTRFALIHSNFRYIKQFLLHHRVSQIDGILFDLGISSHQIDEPQRGFSTRFDGPLDMRMNTALTLTAAEVLNTYDEVKLADLFFRFGEIPLAKKVARIIVEARRKNRITATSQFKALFDFIPDNKKNKFFAQLFQALRIEVNQELVALREALEQSLELLKPGGRIVVISYHSLEDRMVKHFLRVGNFDGKIEEDIFGNKKFPFKVLTKKAIVPTIQEIEQNSRARSAKLRVAEKL